jgi:hypothetical protein
MNLYELIERIRTQRIISANNKRNHRPAKVNTKDIACPYCISDNDAIRETYYDQTCKVCVERMNGAI